MATTSSEPSATVQQCITRLADSLATLTRRETEHLTAQAAVIKAKRALADEEADCYINGLPGSNAEQRNAHLYARTRPLQIVVEKAENYARACAVQTRLAHEQVRAARAILAALTHAP